MIAHVADEDGDAASPIICDRVKHLAHVERGFADVEQS